MTLEQFLNKFKREESEIIEYKGDEALKAVKEDGDALRYVKEQTEEICLEAVKENGYALKYVKEQTEEICLKAVEEDGDALQYVDKSVFKGCLELTIQDIELKFGCRVKIINRGETKWT